MWQYLTSAAYKIVMSCVTAWEIDENPNNQQACQWPYIPHIALYFLTCHIPYISLKLASMPYIFSFSILSD